jgi:hypothetical protein
VNLHELIEKVPEQWRVEFLRFVETGNASEDFLAFLDRDVASQEAVDAVFERQAQVLEDLARGLRANDPVRAAQSVLSSPATARSVNAVATDLTRALSQTATLPEPARREVFAQTEAAIGQVEPKEKADDVRKAVADMAEAISG